MSDPKLSDLLSIAEVAERLGVSYGMAWRHINAGRINSLRVAGKTVVPEQALENYQRERAAARNETTEGEQ